MNHSMNHTFSPAKVADVEQPSNLITRRQMLQGSGLLCAAALTSSPLFAASPASSYDRRPAPAKRKFVSHAIEAAIVRTKKQIADPQLAGIFENCFPNTLDTTVSPSTINGKPDTFVVTGDIDAMWLRDSSAQLMPYLPFAKEDPELSRLLEGAIRRQASLILIDPYANAFMPTVSSPPLSWSLHDDTDMHPGVGERKWEIDSLCYPIQLAHAYWKATGNAAPFDEAWKQSAHAIVRTFREQQRKTNHGPYHFQRAAASPTDTLMLSGYGRPIRPNGLICSMFRPSDDACIYPFFIPANLFAVASLRKLAELATGAASDQKLASDCNALAAEVAEAVARYGIVEHPTHGKIYAYEIDGYGNHVCMDDANAPGLLSLPFLGACSISDPLYQRTRGFALSKDNPYFFQGKAAEGIGGPHIGLGYIWPMSILIRAFTSNNDAEIRQCIYMLRNTTGGKYFMHESFQQDNPKDFTRAWFAWANTLFGELILKLATSNSPILREDFSIRT
jgi:meiotically up-regulated gene 157 (Mug157) protein